MAVLTLALCLGYVPPHAITVNRLDSRLVVVDMSHQADDIRHTSVQGHVVTCDCSPDFGERRTASHWVINKTSNR